jgi:AcrR family transcriptional regulator
MSDHSAGTSTDAITIDGRSERRNRGREQVLDAAIQLFSQGNLDPTPEQVAALAGVSGRTVYRYFEDRSSLMRASIERHFERIEPLAAIPQLGEGTLVERVDAMLNARIRLFTEVAAAYRAAHAKAPFDPILSERLDFTRAALSQQVELQFSLELDAFDPGLRPVRLAAVDLLLSLESLVALITHRGHSPTAAAAVISEAVFMLLQPIN